MEKRSLNELGIWLTRELNRRNIGKSEFAKRIETTPQNLSDILRGNRFRAETLKNWGVRFLHELKKIDEERGIATYEIFFQVICTRLDWEGHVRLTYGLQMLMGMAGDFRILDEIRDVSLDAEEVAEMESEFNRERLAAVHFRETVLDRIGL